MDKQLIDNCFYVEQKKWGTWTSHDIEGKSIVTSLNEEDCVRSTRYYLKLKQENKLNEVETTYSGDVTGKL